MRQPFCYIKLLTGLFAIMMLSNCAIMKNNKSGTDQAVQTDVPDTESFRNQPPEPGPAPVIQLGESQKFTLDNGLQVIVVENHKTPLVTMQLLLDIGKINFGSKNGLDSITADLLMHGTASMPKATFDEAVDNLGATLYAHARGMNGTVLSKYWGDFFRLFSDALLNPAFTSGALDLVRKQYEAGLEAQKDSPEAIAGNVAATVNFGPNHPQGQFLTAATLNEITLDDITFFHDQYYDPAQAYLMIIGDVELDAAKELCQKYLSPWKKLDNIKIKVDPAPPVSSLDISIVDRPSAVQSLILVSYPVVLTPGAPDAIEASLMNSMLGGYFSSRLNMNLREKQGYTYGIRSALRPDRDNGLFTISTNVRNEVTASAVQEILSEMDRLRKSSVSKDELSEVKNVVSGQFARSLQNPAALARFALDIARYDLPVDYFKNYLKMIDKVTVRNISDAAKKYLHPDKLHLIIVGNKAEILPQLKSKFKGANIRFYNYDGSLYHFTVSDLDPAAPKLIVQRYVDSIGGPDKLRSIHSLIRKDEMMINKVELTSITYIKAPGNLRMSIMLDKEEIQATTVNKTRGFTSENGKITNLSAEQHKKISETATVFEDLSYISGGYDLQYLGIDTASNSFKIKVHSSAGNDRIEYYDRESGLKKITQIIENDQIDQTINYLKYKEINGIKYPIQYEILGTLPEPVTMENVSIEVNKPIDLKLFEIE